MLICDVGHCIEVYAGFAGQGGNYTQFPDRQGFRIDMQELRDEKIRERLRHIWQKPEQLDPARHRARDARHHTAARRCIESA